MRHLFASACFFAGLLSAIGSASAAECGQMTIASMNWQSAEVLASLDKFILTNGFGCDVSIIQGDTVPTITSMAEKAQPDVAPEGWVDLIPAVMSSGLAEGKLVEASTVLSDGAIQGWWIPKFVADAHPDIKTIDDVLKHPELFPDPEDSSKGTIYNGPQGWGGTVVTGQLYKAFAAKKAGFTLTDTGSAAGLDGSIAKAYERKQGWVGYYWAPTALLGKYQMIKLDHGVAVDQAEWKRCTSVADCSDPKKNSWPKDTVRTLVTKSFADREKGPVMDYLNHRAWSNATVNALMAWMTDNQATGEDGAKHFLKYNPDLWTQWVPSDAAERIKSAL